jgi:hypothetical protein
MDQRNKRKQLPKGMNELLDKWQFSEDRKKSRKYLKHEFQDYGVRLAMNLNDEDHKSLYIKLAKEEKRGFLEKAFRFVIDYPGMEGKNKGRLFMWALKKLRGGEELFSDKDKKKKKQSYDYGERYRRRRSE